MTNTLSRTATVAFEHGFPDACEYCADRQPARVFAKTARWGREVRVVGLCSGCAPQFEGRERYHYLGDVTEVGE
jgi:hypothetical protein